MHSATEFLIVATGFPLGRGLLFGLLVGAAGGAILGAMTYSPSKCDSSVSFCVDLFDQGSSAAMGAVLLGGVGALVGFIAGAAPKETWVPVTIPTR